MIPNNDDYENDPVDVDNDNDDISDEFATKAESSLTYAMNLDTMRFTGKIDGDDAIRQAVFKILNTERYKYDIYDWDYGVELEDLKGKPITFVMGELPNRIKEALETDDRIETVDTFKTSVVDKSKLVVSFIVHTENEDVPIESEVEI